jgi:hypothetical protein
MTLRRIELVQSVSLCVVLLGSLPVLAQGQDSTAGERNLRIMAELLPGVYDNANQAYFDGRRKLPLEDRHAPSVSLASVTVRRTVGPPEKVAEVIAAV